MDADDCFQYPPPHTDPLPSLPRPLQVRVYTDRLVQWLQNTLLHQESLVFHVSDVACDFVRDDDGRWWLLQVRSLPLSPLPLCPPSRFIVLTPL